MERQRIVQMVVGGTEVEGVVTFSSLYDIDLVMTKPFPGLKGELHIPFFARRYSFEGEYGERRIREILLELYEQGIRHI